MLDEFLIVVFLTNQGDADIALSEMFWTDSRRFQSRLEIRLPKLVLRTLGLYDVQFKQV